MMAKKYKITARVWKSGKNLIIKIPDDRRWELDKLRGNDLLITLQVIE